MMQEEEKSNTHKEINSVDIGLKPMRLHSEASFLHLGLKFYGFTALYPQKYGQTTLCDGEILWNKLSFKTKNFF